MSCRGVGGELQGLVTMLGPVEEVGLEAGTNKRNPELIFADVGGGSVTYSQVFSESWSFHKVSFSRVVSENQRSSGQFPAQPAP